MLALSACQTSSLCQDSLCISHYPEPYSLVINNSWLSMAPKPLRGIGPLLLSSQPMSSPNFYIGYPMMLHTEFMGFVQQCWPRDDLAEEAAKIAQECSSTQETTLPGILLT